MKLVESFKRVEWGYLVLALILCATGGLLLFYPKESMNSVSYVIGGAALLFGIAQALRILTIEKRGVKFAFSILFATLTIICGAVLFIIPEKVFSVFVGLIGLFIIIDSSFKLDAIIVGRRNDLKAWWALSFFTCVAIVGGFLCIYIRSEELTLLAVLLGLSLLSDGFQNLLSLFYISRLREKREPITEAESDKNEAEADTDESDTVTPEAETGKKKKSKADTAETVTVKTEAVETDAEPEAPKRKRFFGKRPKDKE